jgi:hypothetical protein
MLCNFVITSGVTVIPPASHGSPLGSGFTFLIPALTSELLGDGCADTILKDINKTAHMPTDFIMVLPL